MSAVVADRDVLGVFQPGEHGSTFGGNPLACAVGRAVVGLLATGEYQARATTLGAHLHEALAELPHGDGARGPGPRTVGRRGHRSRRSAPAARSPSG